MAKQWKLGIDQTGPQERAEIRKAQRAGRDREYVDAQRWTRMIEAETARRRARKRN